MHNPQSHVRLPRPLEFKITIATCSPFPPVTTRESFGGEVAMDFYWDLLRFALGVAACISLIPLSKFLLRPRAKLKRRDPELAWKMREQDAESIREMRRKEEQHLREKGYTHYWQLAKNDPTFQARFAPKAKAARQKYSARARPCPKCGTKEDKLDWFYFMTPGSYLQALAGRAGWMTACPKCNVEVDFFVEIMS